MLKYWTNNEHKFWHLDTPEFTYYKHNRARMDLEISVLKVLHPHSSTSNSDVFGEQKFGSGRGLLFRVGSGSGINILGTSPLGFRGFGDF